MAGQGTAIEWTHAPGYKGETWNPVTGCDRVSPGCAHCYALELAGRLKGMGQKRYQRDGDPKTSGPGFAVTLHPDKLTEPLRWGKPRAIFTNSMSDVFHEEIPDEFIARMFAVMASVPRHIFMVLTKRPDRMRALLNRTDFYTKLLRNAVLDLWPSEFAAHWPLPAPAPNIWLGVTIENRRFVHRADLLRETPAAVRFISAEPLLGPLVNLEQVASRPASTGLVPDPQHGPSGHRASGAGDLDLTDIDWLITGGESGPKHRRFDPQWACDLRDACWETGTAFFHKQNGGRTPKAGGRLLDGREWSGWPTLPNSGEAA